MCTSCVCGDTRRANAFFRKLVKGMLTLKRDGCFPVGTKHIHQMEKEEHKLFISPVDRGEKRKHKQCQCPAGIIDASSNVSPKRWEHCSIQQRGPWSASFEQQEPSFCFTSLLLAPISPLDIHDTDDPFENRI